MRGFLISSFVLIISQIGFSQDKLFFLDGTKRNGIIVSNAKDHIYFKQSDTSATEKIEKTKLILIEDYKGTRYMFGNTPIDTLSKKIERDNSNRKLNSIAVQPFGIFVGRGSFLYERFTKDGKFGFVIPIIITFDPFGSIYAIPADSSFVPTKGVSFITGLDLNYYIGKREGFQFFIGPRIRYGTDMFLGGIKGYSIQTQLGWKIGRPDARFIQHLSLGFGFIRVVEVQSTQTLDPKQSFTWGSINYSLGLNW